MVLASHRPILNSNFLLDSIIPSLRYVAESLQFVTHVSILVQCGLACSEVPAFLLRKAEGTGLLTIRTLLDGLFRQVVCEANINA